MQEGRDAVVDPERMAAYLVMDGSPVTIATAQQFWGEAQQIGLTVGGVLGNRALEIEAIADAFSPLDITPIPAKTNGWEEVVAALPDIRQGARSAPKPLEIDIVASQVRVFLPGFNKKQVKLSQNGPQIVVEAGGQRRNIPLPPPLDTKSVTGAKFQERSLILSF